MPNPELVEYVKSELARGVASGDVRSSLLAQGWPLADIDTAFHAAGIDSRMASTATNLTHGGSLASVHELFSRAWEIFKKRGWVLFGVLVLGGIPLAILFAAAFAFGVVTIFQIAAWSFVTKQLLALVGIGAVVLIIIALWIGAAMLYAVRDDMADNGVFGSYRYGWSKIPALFWVSILSAFAVLGGIFLAIIPGIIVGIWLVAARFVVVVEGDRGIYALAKSKAYVAGRWWAVFGRMLAAMAVVFAVNAAMSTIVKIIVSPNALIVAQAVSLIVTTTVNIYMFAYGYALYTSLRESRLEVSTRTDHPRGALNLFIAIPLLVVGALVGYVIMHSMKSFGL
ncbi:MAG: hypothetical protein A2675_02245 [Candidatus Yonathbacteria bacterium RIFCSPHIGHO2_01_FULL_51_10]|uniref:Uncharacterized protein n=1 Tax=Candidatus Yonathbacteria bacterium RIFCSPHIGHO2_01_FULL_51_10 TaxID=1802723 RepID=A0A1G2S719_9BACT|nr:MAG: hypothetical protein A2675_02245 [Candidatus Yonathbacteria bacterium RIFCSPHIGHO2_01_FULL_51_10]